MAGDRGNDMPMQQHGAKRPRRRLCRVLAAAALWAALELPTAAADDADAPLLIPVAAGDGDKAAPAPATPGPGDDRRTTCLTAEFKDLVTRAHNRRVDVATCELPCLPPPGQLTPEQARGLERRLGVQWCQRCIMVRSHLAPDEIERIEHAGGIQLCRDAQSTALARIEPGSRIVQEPLKKVRAVFARDGRIAPRHDGLAVVIANTHYAAPLAGRASAERNAAAMQALLTERAGFRNENVIVALDATRGELERVFGPTAGGASELSNRLKTQAIPNLIVYVASHGASGEDSGEAFILPVDGQLRREEQTGYPLSALYRNLARLGIPDTLVVLEVEFSRDPGALVLAPNAPSNRVNALPARAVAGLAVYTAADRDQKALEDPETGLGLFTRHLIEALSGAADAGPIGNADGTVDSTEAFVFAAQRTQIAARKSFGVLQKPLLSQVRPLAIAKTGAAGAAR